MISSLGFADVVITAASRSRVHFVGSNGGRALIKKRRRSGGVMGKLMLSSNANELPRNAAVDASTTASRQEL